MYRLVMESSIPMRSHERLFEVSIFLQRKNSLSNSPPSFIILSFLINLLIPSLLPKDKNARNYPMQRRRIGVQQPPYFDNIKYFAYTKRIITVSYFYGRR